MARSPWSILGYSLLGAFLGLVMGAGLAAAVASMSFDADFRDSEARVEERREQREAEAAKKPAEPGKGIKDDLAAAAGNGVAGALAPAAEASFLWIFKVLLGGAAGLILGGILGAFLAVFTGRRPTPA